MANKKRTSHQATIEGRMKQVVGSLKLLDAFPRQQGTKLQWNCIANGNSVDEYRSTHPHTKHTSIFHTVKITCRVAVHAHHLGVALQAQLSAPSATALRSPTPEDKQSEKTWFDLLATLHWHIEHDINWGQIWTIEVFLSQTRKRVLATHKLFPWFAAQCIFTFTTKETCDKYA